jgi:hypothetical protein
MACQTPSGPGFLTPFAAHGRSGTPLFANRVRREKCNSLSRCDNPNLAYNYLMANTNTANVNIGDGACYSVGSDRYPATVIAKTAKTVTFQDDEFRAGEGHNYFGAQNWVFSPNPNGHIMIARWSEKRGGFVSGGRKIHIGHRGAYQNPSF